MTPAYPPKSLLPSFSAFPPPFPPLPPPPRDSAWMTVDGGENITLHGTVNVGEYRGTTCPPLPTLPFFPPRLQFSNRFLKGKCVRAFGNRETRGGRGDVRGDQPTYRARKRVDRPDTAEDGSPSLVSWCLAWVGCIPRPLFPLPHLPKPLLPAPLP